MEGELEYWNTDRHRLQIGGRYGSKDVKERPKPATLHTWVLLEKRDGERGEIVIDYPNLERNFSFGAVSS